MDNSFIVECAHFLSVHMDRERENDKESGLKEQIDRRLDFLYSEEEKEEEKKMMEIMMA